MHCVCVCAHAHARVHAHYFSGGPLQALGWAGLYWTRLLRHTTLVKMLFFRNGKKKPLQAKLIASASPKCLNCIGKKSISYLLKPTLTGLLEQHH